MGFQYSGDGAILRHLYRYRFLQPKLLSLLTCRSIQVIRRRLRALLKLGYVYTFPRYAKEEAVYSLSGQGFRFIADELGVSVKDLPYSRKNAQLQAHYIYHSLQVTKFVVNAEIGLAKHDTLEALRFIPEWEHQDVASRVQEEKYLIKERIAIDGVRRIPCYPDGGLLVDYGKPVLFYIEADRGTEDMQRIYDKFEAYFHLRRQGIHQERFGAAAMVVLFILNRVKTRKRIGSMQHTMKSFVESFDSVEMQAEAVLFARRVLFAKMEDINVDSVWNEPIWVNSLGESKTLYTAKARPDNQPPSGSESVGDVEEIVEQQAISTTVTISESGVTPSGTPDKLES